MSDLLSDLANERSLWLGDPVVLKTGGPQMMIVGFMGFDDQMRQLILCRWRVAGGTQEAVFDELSLRLL